jgi:hypothetical protein
MKFPFGFLQLANKNKSLVYHSIGHKRPLWAGKKNMQKSPLHLDHIPVQPENDQQDLKEVIHLKK